MHTHTHARTHARTHTHTHTPLVLCEQLHSGQCQLSGEVRMVQGLLQSRPESGVTGVMLQEDITLEVEPGGVGVLLGSGEGEEREQIMQDEVIGHQ